MSVSLAVFSKFALLRSQILKRGSIALFVRISAMQIIGSVQIVTFVTSVAPTFCAALRFWVFFFCLALLLLLLYLLDCAGVFRSCGSDHGLCPLDSHKPLKRLDRNFYMGTLLLLFGLSGFVLCLRPRRKRFLQLKAKFKPPPPQKK